MAERRRRMRLYTGDNRQPFISVGPLQDRTRRGAQHDPQQLREKVTRPRKAQPKELGKVFLVGSIPCPVCNQVVSQSRGRVVKGKRIPPGPGATVGLYESGGVVLVHHLCARDGNRSSSLHEKPPPHVFHGKMRRRVVKAWRNLSADERLAVLFWFRGTQPREQIAAAFGWSMSTFEDLARMAAAKPPARSDASAE